MADLVHILVTVRKPELWPAALLVFKTLRVGFPEARVQVWGNGLDAHGAARLAHVAAARGAGMTNLPATVHDGWIEGLLQRASQPFWILDTDVVFWGPMRAPAGAILSGRLEPAFDEEWTGTRHVERLHTCAMYIDPARVRAEIRARQCVIGAPWRGTAEWPMIRQTFVPVRGEPTRFYDTTAGLWQAGIGTPLELAVDQTFEHLHCGTYVDVIGKETPGLAGLAARHQEIYADPAAAMGLREQQEEYYRQRAG